MDSPLPPPLSEGEAYRGLAYRTLPEAALCLHRVVFVLPLQGFAPTSLRASPSERGCPKGGGVNKHASLHTRFRGGKGTAFFGTK